MDPNMEMVWVSQDGGEFYHRTSMNEKEELEKGIYLLQRNPQTGEMFLKPWKTEYEFGYKIYGLEQGFITRVVKTFELRADGVGVMLTGLKGTGKTVTAKLIANAVKLPVIVVTEIFRGLEEWLSQISQPVVLFFDELEKMEGRSGDLLTLMDGGLSGGVKRMILATTNELRINSNFLSRPSRFRYVKKFENLSKEVVEEIVDDLLVVQELRGEVIEYVSSLELVTVDLVKAVVEEVNLHQDAPQVFEGFFNASKLVAVYEVWRSELDGSGEKLLCRTTKLEISNRVSGGSVWDLEQDEELFSIAVVEDYWKFLGLDRYELDYLTVNETPSEQYARRNKLWRFEIKVEGGVHGSFLERGKRG